MELILQIIPFLAIVVFLVVWIPMIRHAIYTNIPNKSMWLAILVIGGFIGAIVYYFMVYRQNR